MIDAFPSDRADQPIGIGMLPWRPRRSWSITNTHGAYAPGKSLTIHLISIAQQVCWGLVPSAIRTSPELIPEEDAMAGRRGDCIHRR